MSTSKNDIGKIDLERIYNTSRLENSSRNNLFSNAAIEAEQRGIVIPSPDRQSNALSHVCNFLQFCGCKGVENLALQEIAEQTSISQESTIRVDRVQREVNSSIEEQTIASDSNSLTNTKKEVTKANQAKEVSSELSKWQTFERPEQPSDISPLKELDIEFQKYHIARWAKKTLKEELGRDATKEEYKELCEELTQIASKALEGRKICRIFSAQDFMDALDKGYFQSTLQQLEHVKQRDMGTEHTKQSMAYLQQALFRYPLDTPSAKRPLHAIATHNEYGGFDHEMLEGLLHQEIAFFFDNSIKRYSTVIGNDSMSLVDNEKKTIYACPAPLENPTYKIFSLVKKYPDEMVIWDPREYRDNPDEMPIDYFEVHMHRILMDERLGPNHGTRAVIGDPERLGDETTLKLKKKLDKYPQIILDVGTSEEDSRRLRQIPWIKNMFAGSN